MIKIAHASISENGSVNGAAGDSTGKEVCTRSWYDKDWKYVIRFKNPEMREKIAKAMEAAAANNNIGYSQDSRNTLLREAEKVNWDITKITKKCNCDCSSLVSVAAIVAGVAKKAIYINSNCATTRTLRSRLNNTGLVEVLTDAKYTDSDEYALRGDIYLKEGSHVVVALGNGSKAIQVAPAPAPAALKVGDKVKVKQGAKTYNGGGLASFVYNREHQVKQINGNRVVITYRGIVVCAIHKDSLTKV